MNAAAQPLTLVRSVASVLADLLPELEHARRFADAATAPATRAAFAREREVGRNP